MTSTLQQEASRKLRYAAQTTMRVAQRLYENGYITYMRTDSTTLSESALAAARKQAVELYGADSIPDAPRQYARKVKNAQEAHEAIRPAGDFFRTPKELERELNRDELALYDLIWKRTLASQMADARGLTVSLRLGATRSADGRPRRRVLRLRHRDHVPRLPRRLRGEPRRRRPSDEEERPLPHLKPGDELRAIELEPEGHATTPPSRYTEASLVQALEERGIGRPSTYASILGTILDRGYVFKRGTALVPSFLAFAVTGLLEQHFARLVDYDFTAKMEDDLDRIAAGDQERVDWLRHFYYGGAEGDAGLHALVGDLTEIDARAVNTLPIGEGIVLRVGRYGPYVERGEERASVPEDMAPDELTVEKAQELLSAPARRPGARHPSRVEPRDLRAQRPLRPLRDGDARGGRDREAARRLALQDDGARDGHARGGGAAALAAAHARRRPGGRRGDHGAERPLRPVREEGHRVALARGARSSCSRSRSRTRSRCLAQPKPRRGRGEAKPPLRELGPDPVSGKPVVLKEGRFGPYVTDGETNASLRRGDEPETVTIERAAELLADRRSKGPAPKKKRSGGKRSACLIRNERANFQYRSASLTMRAHSDALACLARKPISAPHRNRETRLLVLTL